MTMIRSTFGFALVVLLTATSAFPQAPGAQAPAVTSAAAPDPAFEVASLKPSNPDPNNPIGGVALPLTLPGGRFTSANTPLRLLIMMAYELQQEAQLAGGSDAAAVQCSETLQ